MNTFKRRLAYSYNSRNDWLTRLALATQAADMDVIVAQEFK